jgi:rhamnulose-1-phosphate aldolase/alcohol dehydrogenase
MNNRWSGDGGRDAAEQLVYQSRLVGAEESLVLWGGGNNSVKTTAADLLGNPLEVMLIKSSGSDMKSIAARQFPAVRLDYTRALRPRAAMTDEEMVDYLTRCLLDPTGPRPSIETLLHAFLPATAVLHTHADAILALTNTRAREETLRRCFGDRVIAVPYQRPGFALSKDVVERFEASPGADGIVLMNHGLITWGQSAREAYERHIELVSRAEAFVKPRPVAVAGRRDDIHELAPALRGALSERRRMVLEFDDSEAVMEFVNRRDVGELANRGAATPDHLLYTKRFALVVQPEIESIRAGVQSYVERYEAVYRSRKSEFAMLDPTPRVVLVPGVGMFTAGKDARAARIIRDIYRHTIAIITAAESLGGYETLSDDDAFHAEYWPLELYKLTLLPPDRELAGQVAVVTGAASGIGRAVALRLAREGAHVAVTDLDLNGATAVAEAIVKEHGLRRAVAMQLDVTSEDNVRSTFEAVCREYGGVDVVISNAGVSSFGLLETLPLPEWEKAFAVNTRGHFLMARSAMAIMREQGRGGSIVFNASKNVTAPGREFGAYSVSKAAEAQLCRIVALEGGEHRIRANMLNPDAIFGDSRFWSAEMREMRARAYGIDAGALPDYYRNRTLLKTEVTADDVAEAALFLAGPRSAKTTGAMLPVDGGVKEAFPR